MINNILITPSINSLFLTGIILLIVFYIFITNITSFYKLNFYNKLYILSLICLTIGIHGILHLGVETKYNFNPYNFIIFNLL